MKKNKIYYLLNYLSISQKILLIFIGCVILPLAIQNAFYYSDTEKNIQNEMMQRLTHVLNEKANRINGYISGALTLSNKYNINEEIYKLLEMDYLNDMSYFVNYQEKIQETLLSDLANNQQVRKMTIYTNNPTVFDGALVRKLTSDNIVSLDENLLDYSFTELTQNKNGPKLRVSQVPLVLKTSYDRSLSIIRPLKYYSQYAHYLKLLRIDIDITYISSILRDSELFDNIVLVGSKNRIIASANTYHEFGSYDIFSQDQLRKGIVVIKHPLKDVPLSLYGYYDSSIISEEFRKMRWKTLIIAFCSMMVASFFILLFAGNITKRIKLVVNQSKQIAKGNFTQLCHGNIGSDEIGVLADSINLMSRQLQDLIEEKYKSRLIKAQLERETAQAKLLALQSQVNPHFMFNALESIRLKAIVKNEEETAKMIKYMSRMFRHLIHWDEDIICLRDDIKFLNEFLNIQKYRFEEEFEYTIKVDEKALDCLLPKLIIQPLVENACIHGVEAISHRRFVEISATIKENQLLIKVSDNGGGMDESRLHKIRNAMTGREKLTESIGLFNVYQRLTLYYEMNFVFDMISKKGKGTNISIMIPIRHSREEFYVHNTTG